VFQVKEVAGDLTYLRHGITVGPGDVVLDVGANVGVAAVFFATQCGAKLVHSFEPVPPTYELLRANVADLPACRPHPQGVSSAPGRALITYYPRASAMSGLYADPERDRALLRAALVNLGATLHDAEARVADTYQAETFECEVLTLSSFLHDEQLDRVDLLKIDVERAELDVLAGLADDDWRTIRQIVMEVHDAESLSRISGLLADRGFGVVTEQDDALRGTAVHVLYAKRPRMAGTAGRARAAIRRTFAMRR
jgi:FkbM family methyltransferase